MNQNRKIRGVLALHATSPNEWEVKRTASPLTPALSPLPASTSFRRGRAEAPSEGGRGERGDFGRYEDRFSDIPAHFVTSSTQSRHRHVTLQFFPKGRSNSKITLLKHTVSQMNNSSVPGEKMKPRQRVFHSGTSNCVVRRPAWTGPSHGVPALAGRVLPLSGKILGEVLSDRLKPGLQTVSRIAGLVTLMTGLLSLTALANPIGMTVTSGSASSSQNGSQLTVRASQGAVLNWQSFNIQRGQTTTFVQPSSTSVVWNRILDPNLSQVWGNLNANGWVVLMNQNGFYFGPNSVINVHGLMVTTSPIAPESSGGGGMWQFNGTPPLASIINYGEIHARAGGSVFLVSERVENHGTISAPGGSIGLYAGKEVLVSERPDGRGISASVKLPAGSVDNTGKLIADAGTIAMHAQVVNQNGLVQANTVRQRNGVIELVATEELTLGSESVLTAKGEVSGVSQGGSITVKSDQRFTDAAGSRIDVSGGLEGGNGGSVEISAAKMSSIQSHIDGSAKAGWKGGTLDLDPTDIILSASGSDSAGSGTIHSDDAPDTLHLNVGGASDGSGSAFVGFSQIHLEATRDILVDPNTTWNLNLSTGISDSGSMLTLEAGRNIEFGDNSRVIGGMGWSVRFAAGVDFSSANHSVINGVGSIHFNGSSSLETSDGSISLAAGHEVVVGSGFIRTVGAGSLIGESFLGGNIDITTGDGDINAGTKPDWYTFFTTRTGSGYDISPQGLGGIGTAYGGNVTLNSGHDIVSIIPTVGAYGVGDVTLTAANRILGKFIIRNGHGMITAGGDLGSGSSPVSLSLVGDWLSSGQVTATQSGTTLTANGAAFSEGQVGKYILFNGAVLKITAFVSPTAVTVDNSQSVATAIPFKMQTFELSSGAITATQVGKTVTASDAIFSVEQLGRYISLGGTLSRITAVISPTEVTVETAQSVATATPFQIKPFTASGWDVHAQNVYLNEVLNPNGSMNDNRVGVTPDRFPFRFDYGADAYVHLTGNSSVQLLGSSLAHAMSNLNSDRPPIYAPILEIHAGAGGLVLGNDVVLYPSPLGSLHITTMDHGSIASTAGNYFQLVMSDSASSDYRNFATGHGTSDKPTPLHVGDTDPVSLIVDGDLQNFFLRSPKRTDITVGGNALNFTFEGQNLSLNDASHITIGGKFFSRSDRTGGTDGLGILSDSPSEAAFFHIFVDPLYLANQDVAAKVAYNSTTHTLVFQGKMTEADRQFLLNPYVLVLDPFNVPLRDNAGNLIYAHANFTADTAAINALYAASQDVPTSGLAYNGLQIGGPGSLAISAQTMDFGISHGIRSVGAFNNYSLASISQKGANLTLSLAGYSYIDDTGKLVAKPDLTMTSSQIASYNGGDISVTAHFAAPNPADPNPVDPTTTILNIGSQGQFSSDDTPKGIYTAHGGNVTVTADGSININGSRIATYDGGNVSVESKNGDVDAGGGARGTFTVSTLQLNAKGNPEVRNDRFFGSGIVALTRTDSSSQVGNVTVKADRDILASAGGVLQLAFNGTDISQALVKLDAKRDIVANQSGVLGANIDLNAGRNIIGLVVGAGNVTIQAVANVTANVLGGGAVSVSGGQSVIGNFVGGGNVTLAGENTSGATAVSTGGNTTGGQAGGVQTAAAPVATQTTTENEKAAVTAKSDEEDETAKKKRLANSPVLSKTTGRVTVILPNKN